MSSPADVLYQLIKTQESQFPIPAPYITINVGTLDAAGNFSGLTTKVDFDPEPIEHDPKQRPINSAPKFEGAYWVSVTINAMWQRTITSVPAPIVALAPILLQFSVANAGSTWSVTVNGITVNAPSTQTTLTVSIWDSAIANWTIQAGAHSHTDSLRIQRPAGLVVNFGVGAFTIPALPTTIVYAPPADSLNKSVASYTNGQTVGTTVTNSFGTDSSQTNTNEGKYQGDADFVAGLNVLSQFLGTLTGANAAETAAYALGGKDVGLVSSALGKFSSTMQSGISDLSDNQITLIQTTTDTLSTVASAGGPGSGDLVQFYKDVRMVWSLSNGQLRLFPFDFTLAVFSAGGMQKNLGNGSLGITDADAEMLLALDPFVAGGPEAALSADRFTFMNEHWEYGFGTVLTQSLTNTRDTKNTTTVKNYTTTTDEWDPGPIFQLLGLGGKDSTTISLSNATGSDVSATVTLSVTLVSGLQDHFAVNVFYDNLFGTFAFQQTALSPTIRLEGDGALPGQQIALMTGDQTFRTVADQSGKYSFWAQNIPAGGAKLGIGTQTQIPVTVAAM